MPSSPEILVLLRDKVLERIFVAMWQDRSHPLRLIERPELLARLLAAGRFGGLVLELSHVPHPDLASWTDAQEGPLHGRPILLILDGEPGARLTWLADGATDLLASGPEVTELILRLQARLREAEPEAALAGTVALGPAVLDLDRSEWRLGSRIVHLTPLEVSLMALLGQNAGRLVSMTRMLTEGLGHPGGQGSPEAVRNHIRNLRLKLEPDPAHPQLLVNIPGRGYMLQEPKIYLT